MQSVKPWTYNKKCSYAHAVTQANACAVFSQRKKQSSLAVMPQTELVNNNQVHDSQMVVDNANISRRNAISVTKRKTSMQNCSLSDCFRVAIHPATAYWILF